MDIGDVSYHAEEVALRRAGDSDGATIYVARVTRRGDLGIAKPCARCTQDLIEAGVHTVVWTTEYGLEKSKVRNLVLSVA